MSVCLILVVMTTVSSPHGQHEEPRAAYNCNFTEEREYLPAAKSFPVGGATPKGDLILSSFCHPANRKAVTPFEQPSVTNKGSV